MDNSNDMAKLLNESVLPLMTEMIKAMGEHSYRYESHIKDIKGSIGGVESLVNQERENKVDLQKDIEEISNLAIKIEEQSVTQEEAFGILTNTITMFGERLTNLIDTNNKLIKHQHQQTNIMEGLMHTFEENTSRLDTLTLAINDLSSNTGHFSIQEESNLIGPKECNDELATIKNDIFSTQNGFNSIQDVLDNQLNKIKDNTKG